MPHWNEVFESVESYDSMTIEALQYSKIGKGASVVVVVSPSVGYKIDDKNVVMKKIMGLTTIPLNDKYELTKRAGKLMHQVCPCRFRFLLSHAQRLLTNTKKKQK